MENYILQDGGKITASSAPEFVTRLREGSRFDSECTDNEFMIRFAERYKLYSGNELSTFTPEEFLQDLLKIGYAKEI